MNRRINARELALHVLLAVDERKAYANLALGAVFNKWSPDKLDRSFATELTYGTLRSLNTLDWALNGYSRRPLPGLSAAARNILRLGAYQIMFMDRVPDSAAVNEAARLARQYEHEGVVKFVNGVLRNLARGKNKLVYPDPKSDPEQYLSLRYAHPLWLIRYWLKEFGLSDTEMLCRFNNQPAPNTIRVNTLRTDMGRLIQELTALGMEAHPGRYAENCLELQGLTSLGELESFQLGLCTAQDESSILAGQALSPSSGSKVLDVAAAPGGKTTHLAQLMKNKGQIIALDVHEHKLKLIEENCRRLGVTIVEAILEDAREIPLKYKNWADYILVDAPCSGLGVLRRRPDARWRKELSHIAPLAELQAQILDSAAVSLKPGGVLVYSTCTISREENIMQMQNFLKKHQNFKPSPLTGLLPGELDKEATLAKGYLQILPQKHRLDGFFIARFKKAQ